jgi:hypothetical protein
MNVRTRSFRVTILAGALSALTGLLWLSKNGVHNNFAGWAWLGIGTFQLVCGLIPHASVDDKRLIFGPFIFPRTILLKDIVRIERDLSRKAAWDVKVIESSGRETKFSPSDATEFLKLLNTRVPKSTSISSTGVEPPPFRWFSDLRPVSPLSAFVQKSPWAWMSIVYDAKTHSLKVPDSEAN